MDDFDTYVKDYLISFVFPKHICLTCTPKEYIEKMKLFDYKPCKVYNKCIVCVRKELIQKKDWCGNS